MQQGNNTPSVDSAANRGRPERELIDARGSIDSRTFNEEQRISSVAKDARDRHAASVETTNARYHWHSSSGRGTRSAAGGIKQPALRGKASMHKQPSGIGFTRSVLSGPADYATSDKFSASNVPNVPLFFKVAIPVIIILIIVAIAVVVI